MINLASAGFCLGCSAAFHLFYVKSPQFLNVLARLDYGGISVLIFGSALPIIYYSFACDPELTQRWIWIGIEAFLCTGCFITTLIKKFDSARYRPVRGGMFIAAGMSIIAVFIAIRCFGNSNKIETNIVWYLVGGGIYILGALFYIARVPERCSPGKFDLCGASH